MPTVRRNRTIAASPEDVWRVAGDEHHLPRWWPKARKVEGVDGGRFTLVLRTKKGRDVRAGYRLAEDEPGKRRAWAQDVEGTAFERILHESVTTVVVEPAGDGASSVTIELRQRMRGLARFGSLLVRRASGKLLDEALDGLQGVVER
jgi:uncharacterized protein YndB with AHSA1/START domain